MVITISDVFKYIMNEGYQLCSRNICIQDFFCMHHLPIIVDDELKGIVLVNFLFSFVHIFYSILCLIEDR